MLAQPDQLAIDDRQGQRQAELDARALPAPGLDGDVAAELQDVPAHDVHADAAARDVGDGLRGREAGHEDELGDGGVVEHGVGADQATLLAAGQDPRQVEAGAVVGDLDQHVPAPVLGVEPDAKDRDGRPHRLEVKVKKGGLEVRSRQLVLVPKPKTP